MKINYSRTLTAFTGAAMLTTAAMAVADNYEQKNVSQGMSDYQKMSEKVISADTVLSGDVTNGFNTLGSVRDLVLTPDGKRVAFVLYEVPYPYSVYGANDGYVAFDNVAFDSTGATELNIRIDDEASIRDPQELTLTRQEADHRLLSRLDDGSLRFSGDEGVEREIEDVLIDRRTGEITHYVVAMDEDSLFNLTPRAIPAEEIDIDAQGNLTTDVTLNNAREMAQIDPDFLK